MSDIPDREEAIAAKVDRYAVVRCKCARCGIDRIDVPTMPVCRACLFPWIAEYSQRLEKRSAELVKVYG